MPESTFKIEPKDEPEDEDIFTETKTVVKRLSLQVLMRQRAEIDRQIAGYNNAEKE